MNAYEEALRKQYEQQLQASREATAASVQQAESALPQYSQQRENGARQAYVRLRQGESELKNRLAEAGINGGESETSQLKLQTQYGNEISSLNESYRSAEAQIAQQVNALRLQGQKQESDVNADYYAKLAQLTLQLQQAEAAAKAQAEAAQAKLLAAQAKASNAKKNTQKSETAKSSTKKTVQEKVAQQKAQSAQKAANRQPAAGGYVTVDGVKLTPEELELRLKSGSILKNDRGEYTFAYQRYPYWRKMITK